MNKGKIVQIIGPVVDVEFPEPLPAIYNALTIEYDLPGGGKSQTDARSRSSTSATTGCAPSPCPPPRALKRGYEVVDTGGPISMPVGEAVMGRVFNVTGDAVDEQGPVKADKYCPIHRPAPTLLDQSTSPQVLDDRHQGH